MATETKGKTEEKLAAELADPQRHIAYLRDKIEAVRASLIRTHNKAFPAGAKQTMPASTGINRAIDDLSEVISISDLAAHLASPDA